MKHRGKMHFSSDVSALASAPTGGVPLIEVTGNTRVLIENHRGVTSYGLNEIRINVCGGIIEIIGEKMEILCMSKERIIICGVIISVHLLRGDSK